ncbi:ATP-binding protein [Escherichia coli]|uniref:ATP-binding protein n=2 Tax=Gammaproteobacteria TaxID=1236 RepID=UPI0002CAAFB9|nr:ATP-binding protein [Escherichia coli]EEZ9724920.1 ATP-binding protein [Escherichia coli]EFB8335179.1 ATP-binding protein [Escherichia coli]EFC8585191.1 ATP-binding protein [Escherichia coli]EFK6874651.1 ATP-binding protein [Escherichia coli]EHK0953149.1 ATP-binding protein [Escherichia coli]
MDNKYIKPIENLSIGKIIEVDGSRIIAELDPMISDLSRVFAGENYPIGQFGSIIKVHFGRRSIYGLVSRLRMKADYQLEKGLPVASSDERIIEADLFGEGEWRRKDENEFALEFERGVATYPLPQQTIYLTPKLELRSIYGDAKGAVIELGEHVGSGGAPCYAELNELLGKHTAILGSTGAGKSGTVAAVIHSILERGQIAKHEHWHPQIIILDPHNEYGKAFPAHQRLSTDEGSLKLPYWLLDLEESLSLFIGKTEFAATSQSNIVKNALIAVREQAAEQLGLDKSQLTVDSPVPYVLGDSNGLDHFGKKDGELYTEGLIGAINQQRPSGADKKAHEDFSKVIRKIDSLLKDGRLKFMMESWNGAEDPLPTIVNQFLTQQTTVQIVDLSGVPNEVAGVASAAIARIVFQLKVWQTEAERQNSPVLLVCEEAHRYVPNRGEAQYEAAQSAIRRIAKEGRKYGVGLLLVSQRPSEVEATVLSQCNSWIVLRITNDADREHVRSVLPDSMSGLTKMLSGLRRQEAIFVGQAATLPTRVMIRSLSDDQLPRSNDVNFDKGWQQQAMTIEQIGDVVTKWRYQSKCSQQYLRYYTQE